MSVSEDLIRRPEEFSAGASPLSSAIQWNQSQSTDLTPSGPTDSRSNNVLLALVHRYGSMQELGTRYDITAPGHINSQFSNLFQFSQDDVYEKLLRLLCVNYILKMPSAGLLETRESLISIYTFWKENEAIEPEQKSLPQKIKLKKLGQATRREVMIPKEDE